MKLVRVNNEIISLENVRRVNTSVTETSHTSYGRKYVVQHYSIRILYHGGEREDITCGENEAGEMCLKSIIETIFEILSKDE